MEKTIIEFADNGKVKTVTIAGNESNPAIMDLSIAISNTAEPNRTISMTETEAGAVMNGLRDHFKDVLKEKGVKV